jgi:hypothetical protein
MGKSYPQISPKTHKFRPLKVRRFAALDEVHPFVDKHPRRLPYILAMQQMPQHCDSLVLRYQLLREKKGGSADGAIDRSMLVRLAGTNSFV